MDIAETDLEKLFKNNKIIYFKMNYDINNDFITKK